MEWNVTCEETEALVPEGQFSAILSEIKDVQSQHGMSARFEFFLTTDDEFEGRKVSGLARKKLCDHTKLGRWVAAILGRALNIGEKVNADDLLNKECMVTIKHNAGSNGQVFANVHEIHRMEVPF